MFTYETSFGLLDPLTPQLHLEELTLVLRSQMLMHDETRRGFCNGFAFGRGEGYNDSQSMDHWGSLGVCPHPSGNFGI